MTTMSPREEVQRDYVEYKEKGRVWGQVPPERITKIKFPAPIRPSSRVTWRCRT